MSPEYQFKSRYQGIFISAFLLVVHSVYLAAVSESCSLFVTVTVFCVHHSSTIQSIVTIALFKFWCQLFLTFVFNSLDKKSTFRYIVYANYVLSGDPIRYWNADRGWEVYFCDNVYLHFNLLHRSGVASTDTYKSIIQSWGFT